MLELGSKIVLGSTHVVEQLLFSIVPSILTFDFDLILGSFFKLRGGASRGRFVCLSVCLSVGLSVGGKF